MRRVAQRALLVVGLAACGRAGEDEAVGDREYARGRYVEAAAAYRRAEPAGGGSRLTAKRAMAAFAAGELREAAELWLRLAAEDPTRTDEAADGLDLVAREAARGASPGALRAAVFGLLTVAPARPIGRHALALVRQGGAGGADLVAVLPAAVAAAPDAGAVDSLFAAWGAALEQTGACDQAIVAHETVLRRAAAVEVRARSVRGVQGCAVRLGRDARAAGATELARRWFYRAADLDPASEAGRAAALELIELEQAELRLPDLPPEPRS